MENDLSKSKCLPCEAGMPALSPQEIAEYAGRISGWQIIDNKKLSKAWKFKNFVQAQDFVNAVGRLAEEEGHHPDIAFGWGYAKIELTTHAVKGLSPNDFILAAKIDAI